MSHQTSPFGLWTSLLVGILAGCAPGPSMNSTASEDASAPISETGYFNEHGVPYVSDDPRLHKSETPSSPTATPPTPASSLRTSVREVEISRFAAVESPVSRFGTQRVEIKVFFQDRAPLEFKSALSHVGDQLTFSATAGDYQLNGNLHDERPTATTGEWTLTHESESAVILYRAYKAKLTVREDREKTTVTGSDLDQQLRNLRENTFAWVHNWAVREGRAFYLVDVVKIAPPEKLEAADHFFPAPVFAFKGESLRTGDEVHQAVSLTPNAEVTLVGNGEEQSRKMFAVTIADPHAREKNEIMLDVEKEEPKVELPSPRPTPNRSTSAFLSTHLGGTRATRMAHDFERNRNSRGVMAMEKDYQTARRLDLNNFYLYANPFRSMIERIGQAYDVSPSYAYLTVIESSYFTGGRYDNRDRSSVAVGPFQFRQATAQAMGLRVTQGDDDERYYFAPSACGAAKYIRNLVDQFADSDTTLAILAYNQGQGGAAAAIYCSYAKDVADRQVCAQRINHSLSGSDYDRYIRLAKRFNYTFAEMDTLAAIPKAMRDYVNRKLAIYFISSDLNQFGFSIPSTAKLTLPKNNSVLPPKEILDPTCRQAVN